MPDKWRYLEMFGLPTTLDEILEFQRKAYAQRAIDRQRPPEPGEPVAELNLRTLNAHLDINDAGLATMLVWDGETTVRFRPGCYDTSHPAIQGAHMLSVVSANLATELGNQLETRLRDDRSGH